jgi:hypothetical protein
MSESVLPSGSGPHACGGRAGPSGGARRVGRWVVPLMVGLGAAALLGSGCESAPFEQLVAGKACGPAGECLEGYVCHAGTNICVPVGTAGGAGAGPCQSITDCPLPASSCESRICVGGECGAQAVVLGTPVPLAEQNQGDCLIDVCDGQGGVTWYNDDTDLPDDGQQCTQQACISGVAATESLDVGTICSQSGGKLCDGQGSCVQCLGVADCTELPMDDECQQRQCPAGACGQSFAADGTALSLQQGGDCHVVVCDGMGGTTTQIDDSDLPLDGRDCTLDVCTGGTPSNPPAAPGTGCGVAQALVCDSLGNCTGCTSASECGVTTFCQTFACEGDQICDPLDTAAGTALPLVEQTLGDCRQGQCNGKGGVEIVADEADLPPDDGNECTAEICVSGSPQHPPRPFNTACTVGGVVCDGAGSCVQCNSPSHCAGGTVCQIPTCGNHTCGLTNTPQDQPAAAAAQTVGDCRVVVCDGQGGTLSATDSGDVPVDDNDCTLDLCTGTIPSNPPKPAGTPCGVADSGTCDGQGHCSVKKAHGASCLAGSECQSSLCVDAVCCGSPCGAACMACSAAKTGGNDGVCGFVLSGQDPDSECPLGQTCNGSGACSAGLCGSTCESAGGSCDGNVCVFGCGGPASCPGEVVCPPGLPCRVECTGTGSCEQGVDCTAASSCDITCGPTACGELVSCAGSSCAVRCVASAACQGVVSCSASSCTIACDAQNACGSVDCAGDQCDVDCSKGGSCNGGVSCTAGQSCAIHCNSHACGGAVACGPAACTIDCSADDACGSVDCSTACSCSADCTGEGACLGGLTCTSAPCQSGLTCAAEGNCSSC